MTASDPNSAAQVQTGPESDAQPTASQSFRWPMIAAGLLLGHAVLMLVAVMIATIDPGATAAEAGYAEALDWDRQKEALHRSELLMWTATVTPSAVTAIDGGRQVVIELWDRDHRPIDHATVTVVGYHFSQAHRPFDVGCERVLPGVYRGTAPMRRPGAWRLRVSAQRGEDRFVQPLEVWVAPIEGSAPPLLGGPKLSDTTLPDRGDP